ncbi:MAG: hypothetical protein WC421_02945 [Elusimicrobiales bacterium]
MSGGLSLSPRERMWRVARGLQLFSLEDLSSVGTARRGGSLR